MGGDEIKQTVKEKYGQAALRVAGGERGSCGGTGSCGCDPVSSNLYDAAETATLPEGAVLASLGCGNPTALAELHEGEVVLDLGSGGGIDVLLSAKRVGRTGKAYGLDMTHKMPSMARESHRKTRRRTRGGGAGAGGRWLRDGGVRAGAEGARVSRVPRSLPLHRQLGAQPDGRSPAQLEGPRTIPGRERRVTPRRGSESPIAHPAF